MKSLHHCTDEAHQAEAAIGIHHRIQVHSLVFKNVNFIASTSFEYRANLVCIKREAFSLKKIISVITVVLSRISEVLTSSY